MIRAIISAIASVVELLLVFRFLFRLLGANPESGFVMWLYDVTRPLVAPFAGIFGQPATPGVVVHGTFEWASILALVVYGIVASMLLRFLPSERHEGW